jgi:hypothetical protein
MQLGRYLEQFPLSRILVIDQADLATNRAGTLARVFRFVDVDDCFTTPAFAHRHNPTDGLHANAAGALAIRALDKLLGGGRSARIRSGTPRALVRPLLRSPRAQPVELDPVLHAELIAYLKPDSDRLCALTGRQFAGWCTWARVEQRDRRDGAGRGTIGPCFRISSSSALPGAERRACIAFSTSIRRSPCPR